MAPYVCVCGFVKPTLCTTATVQSYIVKIDLHCAPCVVHHGALLQDTGPPCAPWSAIQVSGVQCRSVVHNEVLCRSGGAQRISHKPRQMDRQKAMHKSPPCMSFILTIMKSEITLLIQGGHEASCDENTSLGRKIKFRNSSFFILPDQPTGQN